MREGRAAVLVPADHNVRGPGRAGGVFYNRQMEFGRDVCISLLNATGTRGKMLDAMCATGIRSVRMGLELDCDTEIIACDTEADACALAKLNMERNGVTGRVVHGGMLSLLGARYSYIDIDPYGTPVRFILPSLLSLKNGGVAGITATDTAVLCAAAPGCSRRYMARTFRCPFVHELGLRILLGYTVRQAASVDLAAEPLLSYSADHYFRIYVRVHRGPGKAEALLDQMAYVSYDGVTGNWVLSNDCKEGMAGPVWTGRLHSMDVLEGMRTEAHFATERRMRKMLDCWKEEADAPPFYHTLDELSSRMGGWQPSMKFFTEQMKGKVRRTHFDPKGFKTTVPMEELISALRGGMAEARCKGR